MKDDEGKPIHGDWQNLTMLAEFQEFQIIGFASHTVTQATAPTTVTPAGHTGGNTPFSPKVRDLVLEFKKEIKRDPSSFTALKDNKQWGSVHRTLKAQTCYQDVNGVLSPCYVPNTAKDIALFDGK
jgi:hypothetical protein